MILHHSGFVVSNIDEWEKKMIFEEKIKEVVDEIQHAKLSLYKNFGSSYIELIQPLNESSFTWNALRKSGNHFNHFCYSISSEEELAQYIKKYSLIKVLSWVPALLFDNKLVSFYYTRNKQIVEFLISQ
jgi:hypothetical protein